MKTSSRVAIRADRYARAKNSGIMAFWPGINGMDGFTEQQGHIVQAFMADQDIPGAAVALVHGGVLIAEQGFGLADMSTGRAPTPDTLWPIASLTKSFTAVAAMQLVEEGLLDLDAPIADYLPRLCVANPDTTRRLSMRRLLTHTSGLGRTGHQDRTREESINPYPTREALVAALDTAVPQAPVGRCFSYSNESYAIAGRSIEVLRGKPLEDCFLDQILAPVGMTRSRVRFREWRSERDRAVLYAGEDIGPYGSGTYHGAHQVVELVDDYQTFLSTGGIVSTAHDLALYQMATMSYAASPLGLSAASLDHMHSAQHLYGDCGWGYGLGYWVMRSGDERVIGHSGGLPGVSTYSLMIPAQRTGVVVLTNRSDIKAMGLAELLMGDLLGPLWRAGLDQPLPIHSVWGSPSAADLHPYLGEYRFRRGPAQVQAGEAGVMLRTPSRYDGPVQEIATCRVARDRFVSLAEGHVIDFVRDGSGEISGFLNSGYRYERCD